MALEFQVLSGTDSGEVYSFAERRLQEKIADPDERAFQLWQVKWRKEALEHYLRLGWSFIARESGRTVGFFLAQPLLFFRGQTQTLWLEHIEAENEQVSVALTEIAVKVAREKHLQRVLIADASLHQESLLQFKSEPLKDDIVEIRTTKG